MHQRRMRWRSGELLLKRQDLPPHAFYTAQELELLNAGLKQFTNEKQNITKYVNNSSPGGSARPNRQYKKLFVAGAPEWAASHARFRATFALARWR